jgi:hypothetical protein
MTNYARMYRFGITPWERYATAAASRIAVRLDREMVAMSPMLPTRRPAVVGCGKRLLPGPRGCGGPCRYSAGSIRKWVRYGAGAGRDRSAEASTKAPASAPAPPMTKVARGPVSATSGPAMM